MLGQRRRRRPTLHQRRALVCYDKFEHGFKAGENELTTDIFVLSPYYFKQ